MEPVRCDGSNAVALIGGAFMHDIDDDSWGNRDRNFSGRLGEALWLWGNEGWLEAREALRKLVAEAENNEDKATALLALADTLTLHCSHQEELLATADQVINSITSRPEGMWKEGPHRLLMRGYMAKAKALFWADDFSGAIHSLFQALFCISDSKQDAIAFQQLAVDLFRHTEMFRLGEKYDREKAEEQELRELWGCENGHHEPWACLQDIYCSGPCACGIEKWLRKKWDCPGNHAGPWNCPMWASDSACPGSETWADDFWHSTQHALSCHGVWYRDPERHFDDPPHRARCAEPHFSDYEIWRNPDIHYTLVFDEGPADAPDAAC
jgi:hypothetical protein